MILECSKTKGILDFAEIMPNRVSLLFNNPQRGEEKKTTTKKSKPQTLKDTESSQKSKYTWTSNFSKPVLITLKKQNFWQKISLNYFIHKENFCAACTNLLNIISYFIKQEDNGRT